MPPLFRIKRRYFLVGFLAFLTAIAISFFFKFKPSFNSHSPWKKAKPESQGMNSLKLEALKDNLAVKGTSAFLVIKNDQIVYEWYAQDRGATKPHGTASAAKSLVGGMGLLVALNDGYLNLDDPVWKYIPFWKDDPLKSQIAIRHLATHSSGLENADEEGKFGIELDGWKGAYWRNKSERWKISLSQVVVLFPPGTKYTYSPPGTSALGYVLAASLKNSPQSDLYNLLKKRIMEPIGVSGKEWSISYGEVYEADNMKFYSIEGGGSYTARAMARVGKLMLNKGYWQDTQLIDSELVEQMISYGGTPPLNGISGEPAPGILWHTNSNKIFPSLPKDAFLAVGANHQVLCVVPSLNLIVVRNGESLGGSEWGESFWKELDKSLFNPIKDAIIPSHCLPSQVIQSAV